MQIQSKLDISTAFATQRNMEDNNVSRSTTMIYRRWQTEQKGYIDSQGAAVARSVHAPPLPGLPKEQMTGPDPSNPPQNGSTPFLSLPTELRLQIYGYLTNHSRNIREVVHSLSTSRTVSKECATTYLYRSPGRVTKANAVPSEVIKLFHVSHKMRDELIDSCFGDRTFVIEASLYRRSVGGLNVLPAQLGMTAWVKKLLLITTIDDARAKGIADLRPLQEMVDLRVLRIVFKALGPVHPFEVANNPLRAVLSCVQRDCAVHIGADDAMQQELLADLGASVGYLFRDNANAIAAYDRLSEGLDGLKADQGSFSGSHVNHGICSFPTCQERHLDIRCVNSQTPGTLPPLEDVDWPLKYICGCVIAAADGGYAKHECAKEDPVAGEA